jgi:hypothetical protein
MFAWSTPDSVDDFALSAQQQVGGLLATLRAREKAAHGFAEFGQRRQRSPTAVAQHQRLTLQIVREQNRR